MQKNFAIVSVFILFAALQAEVMYCAEGKITAIEILYLAFTVVCPILLAIRHSLHNDDSAGNTFTTIPAPCAVLQVILSHENNSATGLFQQ